MERYFRYVPFTIEEGFISEPSMESGKRVYDVLARTAGRGYRHGYIGDYYADNIGYYEDVHPYTIIKVVDNDIVCAKPELENPNAEEKEKTEKLFQCLQKKYQSKRSVYTSLPE